MTIRASLLSSDGAHTLGSLTEDLARQWTANTHECASVNVVFDALRQIFERAIAKVAAEWNAAHDVMRVLPPEVQEPCFGALPVSDRCRLSLVCSHWHNTVSALSGVWNRLDLTDWKPEMEALFARSGHVPLDLTLEMRGDPVPWQGALRSHSDRLRSLELRHDGGDLGIALGFPAPHLEELWIAAQPYNSTTISHLLLDRHAPRLRTLRLTCLPLPLLCPAFGAVISLTLCRSRAPLNHLFTVMPRLQTLHILTHGYFVNMPALPPHSPLRVLRLVDAYITVEQLVQLGYAAAVDVLDVTTTTSNVSPFVDALARWPETAATVRVRADWEFDIVQQTEGRQLRFAVRPHHYGIFQTVFRSGGAAFAHIQRLVLPLSFGDGPYSPPRPMLIAQDCVISLPALRTLSLECGIRRPGDTSFPLCECVAGRFDVPRLARIEVLRAAAGAPIEPVDVADLVALVESILVCDHRDALEVFIDTAAGILLDGDPSLLRTCIGRLLI